MADLPTVQLLVVEDSDLDFDLLQAMLAREREELGLKVRAQRVEDEPGMRAAFERTRFDAVVTDHNMPRFDSFTALKIAKESDPELPVIVLSGEMSEALAVAALHAGADDFILKSRMFRLGPALKKSLEAARPRRERRAAADALAASEARLHALTQHLERVKEQERDRIAREIHDDIGTTLTALKFELSRLARSVGDGAALTHVNAMHELLAHAVAASHRIQHNLHPPVLDAGLPAALDWLSKGFATRSGVAMRFYTNREDVALAPERAAALYRVAQEALSNVSKYATAEHVTMHLFATDEEVTLEIVDDGVGFDTRMLGATPGFGVRSLQERARGLGGWAEIDSSPGNGTTVMVAVPTRDGVQLEPPGDVDES
jgi:signal transduction histidine kinase